MNQLDVIQKMLQLRANPIAMQQHVLEIMETISDGAYQVMDPTNPFTFLVEAATAIGSAAMTCSEAEARKLYATLSVTEEDLYRHMSDSDYLDRFSSPSRAPFTMYISKSDVYEKAIDNGTGIRRLVIPRNSTFRVDNIDFTMIYPIELRIMPHGGLQIAYNSSHPSPLLELESIEIDWRIVKQRGQDFIEINLQLNQMTIRTHYNSIINSSRFVNYYSFDDYFYYSRIYIAQNDGSWKEIKTTHSEQVYDQFEVTAVLKVLDQRLQVAIPSIYFNSNLVNREIRIDIYTTKGPIDKDLSLHKLDDYQARWIDIENDAELAIYSSPINTITDIVAYGTGRAVGGKLPISMSELRKRVIDNTSGRSKLPITPKQLVVKLEDMGYQVITAIDNITDRILQASRALPAPTNGSAVTGAGAMMVELKTSLATIAATPGVAINGERFTLKPSILYRIDNGIVNIVPDTEVSALLASPPDIQANQINSDNLLYTPWHYVIDASQNRMELRAYHLSNPVVTSRNFLQENNKLPLGISVRSVSIETTNTGFVVLMETNSGKTFKELADSDIQVQLSFAPIGESYRAYQNGVLVSTDPDTSERTYRWDIGTNFNISDEAEITLTSFRMLDADSLRLLQAKLLSEFEIVFITLNQNTPAAIDLNLQESVAVFMLPDNTTDYIAMVREGFNIRIGTALPNLWTRARTVVEPSDYLRYTVNVPKLHTSRVYDVDAITGEPNIIYNTVSQLAEVVVLHEIGDPVMIGNDPVYLHEIGDPVLDNAGQPVLLKERELSRIISLMLIDGRYRFASTDDSIEYRESLPDTIADWLTKDIDFISKQLLEKTQIFYYPQKTSGNIEVYDSDNSLITIDAEQRLTVYLTVPAKVYDNIDLRIDITNRVIVAIDAELKKPTISSSNIVYKLVTLLGDDVYGVVVEGLGGSANISTMTMRSENSRPVIGKQLQVTSEGKLAVVDDLTVSFILHRG